MRNTTRTLKNTIMTIIAVMVIMVQLFAVIGCTKQEEPVQKAEVQTDTNVTAGSDSIPDASAEDSSEAQTGQADVQADVQSTDVTSEDASSEDAKAIGSVSDFHTEEQAQYLAGDYQLYKLYANGTEEKSRPEATVLTVGEDCNGQTVVLSLNEDLSDAVSVEVSDGAAAFYNLLIGTTYFYKVGDGEVQSFVTCGTAPRNLYVDGVTNVRDLGGWSIGESGRVRQGMIYRCAKLTASETAEVLISEDGIVTMRDGLAVKTEIDLRTVDDNEYGGLTASVLGDGVTYMSLPIESGGNIILLNKDKLKDIFAVFGDEANYPIAFHCSIGTDRTGMIAFLLNGLLGVEKDDLYRDFLFSNFGEIGKMRAPSIIKTYIDTVEMSQGADLSEKIYNYLVSAGVEASDLDNIKRIMTEE